MVCTCLYGEEQKLYRHELLSAALSRLHGRESNKLMSRQSILLPVLLPEQMQQMSVMVLTRLDTPAFRPRQATSSARQANGPAHFPEHPRHCADCLRTVGVFFGLLT